MSDPAVIIRDEDKLTLSAAAKYVPGNPHASTLWRWCRQRLQGVHLEYLRVGRRIVTSREALDRFFQRVTAADQVAYAAAHAPGVTPSTSKQSNRNQAIAAAEAELADAGIV